MSSDGPNPRQPAPEQTFHAVHYTGNKIYLLICLTEKLLTPQRGTTLLIMLITFSACWNMAWTIIRLYLKRYHLDFSYEKVLRSICQEKIIKHFLTKPSIIGIIHNWVNLGPVEDLTNTVTNKNLILSLQVKCQFSVLVNTNTQSLY